MSNGLGKSSTGIGGGVSGIGANNPDAKFESLRTRECHKEPTILCYLPSSHNYNGQCPRSPFTCFYKKYFLYHTHNSNPHHANLSTNAVSIFSEGPLTIADVYETIK